MDTPHRVVALHPVCSQSVRPSQQLSTVTHPQRSGARSASISLSLSLPLTSRDTIVSSLLLTRLEALELLDKLSEFGHLDAAGPILVVPLQHLRRSRRVHRQTEVAQRGLQLSDVQRAARVRVVPTEDVADGRGWRRIRSARLEFLDQRTELRVIERALALLGTLLRWSRYRQLELLEGRTQLADVDCAVGGVSTENGSDRLLLRGGRCARGVACKRRRLGRSCRLGNGRTERRRRRRQSRQQH